MPRTAICFVASDMDINLYCSIPPRGKFPFRRFPHFAAAGILSFPPACGIPPGMTARKMIKITAWPDPLVQERLEDIGFFFDSAARTWIKFCAEAEVSGLNDWLKRQHLAHEIQPARGRGETRKHPRLSEELTLKEGGSPNACALCGKIDTPCRQWVEGDDTDSIDYPNPARFYLCGVCVQSRMQPHPRLYSPSDESL
jgi:hypothetical protein